MTTDVLTDRALNRATLDRQLLLERSDVRPTDAVEHLVGLQAQNPLDPYLALWSRLDGFDPHELGGLVADRSLVRIVVMRGTVHLVTATDALLLRPLMQPVLDAEIARHQEFAPHLVGVDVQSVLDFAYPLLAEQPMSGRQLRSAMSQRFPELDAAALVYACHCFLPLVQVPPRGVWDETLQVTSTPVQAWVGRPLAVSPSIDEVVLRYLAAFGPSTVADVAAWSRLTGLGEVLSDCAPGCAPSVTRGVALFDVADGARPDPETPAPVRFLPQYDNALLSRADRTRFGMDGAAHFGRATGPAKGSVLVDGLVRAIWRFEHDRPRSARKTEHVIVVVEHFGLTGATSSATEREGDRLARFWHPDAAIHEVRLIPLR